MCLLGESAVNTACSSPMCTSDVTDGVESRCTKAAVAATATVAPPPSLSLVRQTDSDSMFSSACSNSTRSISSGLSLICNSYSN